MNHGHALVGMAGHQHTGLGVKMKKAKLLVILAENRVKHEAEWKQAFGIWKDKMATALRELADEVAKGKKLDLHGEISHLPMPVNMAGTYERLEKMLAHTEEETIELDENQYSQFVEDEWSWKAQTSFINSTYLAS